MYKATGDKHRNGYVLFWSQFKKFSAIESLLSPPRKDKSGMKEKASFGERKYYTVLS